MFLNCGVGEDSWEPLARDQISQSQRKSVLNIHWKHWCWSWSSNTLATWCEKLTHWKRPWCWERLKAVGEGDDRGLDGRMASLSRWTWVCASSGSWWWTGKPGMVQSIGSQRVGHEWATELNIVKGFGIINNAEVDVFLEFSCFFNDPMDVGYLISSSSAFSKSSLSIWKLLVHVLLKPGLENFEDYFASMWDKCNCAVVWTFFGIAFLWDWMNTGLFQSCGHCWVFQIFWHIECSTLTASSFRIWNSF